jgi:hypothetical protein
MDDFANNLMTDCWPGYLRLGKQPLMESMISQLILGEPA